MAKGEIYIFGFRGFPDVQGGVETHVENLAPQLVSMGHRVTACVRSPYVDKKGSREWKGVRLLRLWTVRNTYFEALLHSLICALAAGVRRPHVVHIQGIGPALVTTFASPSRLAGYRHPSWGGLQPREMGLGGSQCASPRRGTGDALRTQTDCHQPQH